MLIKYFLLFLNLICLLISIKNLNHFLLKNERFSINLERTIDFSLLNFQIFNSRKIISTRKKIYYQYTLIELFVQNYIKTFSENIIKFTNYLNSKISYYDTAFLQFNLTITSIYYELSNIINDKYQIISKRKLSEVNSYNYDLLSVNVTIEVKLSTSLAISLGFNSSVSFGLDVGMEDNSIFINAYGEVSLTISGEVYLFLGQSPVELKAGIVFLYYLPGLELDVNILMKLRKRIIF